MEIYVCRALRQKIVRTLNREVQGNYSRDDIELVEIFCSTIYISTKDGSDYSFDCKKLFYDDYQ